MLIIKRLAMTLVMLVSSFGLSSLAHAEPLTSDQVERFIASMPDSLELGRKYDDKKTRNIDPAKPMTSGLALMDKKGPEYADISQLALRHGFTSAEQWAQVGDRTVSAYIVAKSGLSSQQVDQAYQEAVKNINKNPALTEDKKQAILAGMGKGHQRNMLVRQNSDQDVQALKPHMPALDKIFE